MGDWDARLYTRFEDERTRPARDLLARVPLEAPRLIVDLGCGPGNSTQLLVERFPQAGLVGLDSSADMIAAARRRLPSIAFQIADIALFQPERPVDLLFANAVLQWAPDHSTLLPRLVETLAPGGALAVQMPNNLDEPSHVLMREAASMGPWSTKLADAAASRASIGSFEDYYDLLSDAGCDVDLWQTAYVHPLDGAGAIVAWLQATGLRPFLDPLDADEQTAFLQTYEGLVARAYPRRRDGKVLLRFPRLFIVAKRH